MSKRPPRKIFAPPVRRLVARVTCAHPDHVSISSGLGCARDFGFHLPAVLLSQRIGGIWLGASRLLL